MGWLLEPSLLPEPGKRLYAGADRGGANPRSYFPYADPIYQYDDGLGQERQGVISLEPVYEKAGMDRRWVDYFLESIVDQPCLAFNYAQAGQENSFTWSNMSKGLEMQIPILDSLRKENKIRVETLGESGAWFKECFKVTPATAVTTLTDVRGEGNKTVWFNSRYYRANLLWEKGTFRFRDIHSDRPIRQGWR